MQYFDEGASSDPQSPNQTHSALDQEIDESLCKIALEYRLKELDLPWAITGVLVRYLSRRVHPIQTAEFCDKAGDLLKEMSDDFGEIAVEVQRRCH